MDPVLDALLRRTGGVVTRNQVSQVLPRWALENAVAAGRLRHVLPTVYVATDLLDHNRSGAPQLSDLGPQSRRRAVLAYADGRAAFSHTTALELWGLRRQPADEALHLTVPYGAGMRSRAGLTVHHRRGFVVGPPQVVVRGGEPVVRLERSLVESWPLLPAADRPAPLIRAVNDRWTNAGRLIAALDELPRLTDRAALWTLLAKLAAGCRSQLEIWGHDHVFVGAGMPAFRRQQMVRVDGGRTVYLDVYAERERVDFELDGAASHGSPAQREIDLRRDALLAAAGIQVVRFAHRRLIHEPQQVRREILAILDRRR
ncbi:MULTISPECIES: endonuclease domain-containing protein [unclassified Solwaraspora]|uniref:endonuclease domain-containing protein n=1 Tax=unclassified Solwaraspora TaxID=2627926 RepID=UPI00259B2D72|nr:DUF559 domain-containing protein [Solwaraspora sp. WMMA2056]WJK43432.1 DUF559 domain-containing protein [Solwaraspora sp. WMMA2056]